MQKRGKRENKQHRQVMERTRWSDVEKEFNHMGANRSGDEPRVTCCRRERRIPAAGITLAAQVTKGAWSSFPGNIPIT